MDRLELKKTRGPKLEVEATPDPFLRLYQDGEFVRSFRLKPGISVIGRDAQADVSVPDQSVSRKHLQIEYAEENRVYLQDLESQNGTELNGDRVTRARLESGDRIGIGDHELIVSYPKPVVPTKIIPFPSVQTEPRVDVEELKARKPIVRVKAVAVPERRYLPALKMIGVGAVVVSAAAFLAIKAYDWNQGRESRLKDDPIVQSILSRGKKPNPGSTDGKRVRETGSSRSTFLPPKKSAKGLSRSLTESLRGIEDQDLAAADRLVASAPSPSHSGKMTGRGLKGAEKKPITVEIKLPMSHERAKLTKKTRRTLKTFDSVKYRKMLRSKVGSVEGCYAKHAPSSGVGGKVSVWFSIASSGQIRKSGIESSTIKSKALSSCIVKQMLATKVDPPPWNGYTVTYTYRFGGRQKVTF